MVPEVGLEPTRRISPADFESAASTNFATPAGVRLGAVESGRHYNSETAAVNRCQAPSQRAESGLLVGPGRSPVFQVADDVVHLCLFPAVDPLPALFRVSQHR